MEERKLTPNKGKKEMQDNTQKLTYEQLNEACAQLYQQNQNLIRRLEQLEISNMFKRLDYLFKVLDYPTLFKDDDFVTACADEIKEALTVKDEKEKSNMN